MERGRQAEHGRQVHGGQPQGFAALGLGLGKFPLLYQDVGHPVARVGV